MVAASDSSVSKTICNILGEMDANLLIQVLNDMFVNALIFKHEFLVPSLLYFLGLPKLDSLNGPKLVDS